MRENLVAILEGAILAADQPLSIDRMIALFDEPPPRAEVREALEAIGEACADRGFELKEVASGYRFQVRAEYADWISRLWDEKPPRYSRALLETLALIAYKQPITRGDIEEIRGVSTSTNIIRSLLEREWIRVVGHRDVPGRPALYASTRTFLDYFNLASLEELPTLAEIRDLDKVNAELDLDTGDTPTPRILDLEPGESDAAQDEADGAMADTVDLDAVTDQVNQIQENIRNLFAGDDESNPDGEETDGDEGVALEGAAPEGAAPEGAALEGAAPEGAAPEGAALEGAALEGAAQDRAAQDRAHQDRAALDGAAPEGAAPAEAAPDGDSRGEG